MERRSLIKGLGWVLLPQRFVSAVLSRRQPDPHCCYTLPATIEPPVPEAYSIDAARAYLLPFRTQSRLKTRGE
jgi:hypothetical protein